MTYRRNYHAPGTPPGTYDVDRTRAAEPSRVVVIEYSTEQFREIEDPPGLDLPAPAGVRWVRISGHPSLEVLEGLREHFQVDPLVLEDIVTSGQRPKFNEIGTGLFFTLSLPKADKIDAGRGFQQLSLYVSGNTLITHLEAEGDLYEPLIKRLEQKNSRLRQGNPYFLLYGLIDLAIDHLFPLLDELGARMESLEGEILSNPTQALLGEVHGIRNDLLFLRKITWATRELVSELLRHVENDDVISVRAYIQDAHDHIVSAIDLVETYRDMATSLVEVHQSVVSNRLNDVMRVLTIIATVFIPPTFVVGVYGMNFDRTAGVLNMPELGWPLGYLIIMALIALMMIAMLIFFRHKRWL